MSTVFRIHHCGQWRDLDESDFPLAIAITDAFEIAVDDAAEMSPDAWLGFDRDRSLVFIQPAIQINGDLLAVSGWLSAGDQVRIAGGDFSVVRDAGILALAPVVATRDALAGTPPVDPVPTGDAVASSTDSAPQAASADLPVVLPVSRTQSRTIRRVIGGIFLLLLAGVFFVLSAVPVKIDVAPTPDALSLTGTLPAVMIGERYLAIPGTYRVKAQKSGYRELATALDVDFGSEVTVAYQMQKLPGFLDVVSPPVEGAEVRIDGKVVGKTPLASLEIEAGRHEILVSAERYLPHGQVIEVQGMGQRQSLDVSLQPGWGSLVIASEPQGADVWLDGRAAGKTPIQMEPMAGEYQIEIRKDGWKRMSAKVKVEAGKSAGLPVFRLVKVDGVLSLTSNPPGAQVTFDDQYAGSTPLSLELSTGAEHRLTVAKAGYATVSRIVRLEREPLQTLNLDLEPEFGIVFITSRPADAELKVDGKVVGSASRRLRLTTRSHDIEIAKPGYETYTTTLTPDSKDSVKLDVRLNAVGAGR